LNTIRLEDYSLLSHEISPEPILAISLSNNNFLVYAKQMDNSIAFAVTNLETGEKVIKDTEKNFQIKSFKISPDGRIIAILHDGFIDLWDISNSSAIERRELRNEIINTATCFAFSPDSNHILIGCDGVSESLMLYDISNTTNIIRKHISSHDKRKIFSVGWCLDGTKCFSISDKATNNLIIWDFIDKQK
jgi:hypothetical protein